jgi:hypothetical protein
VTEEIITVQLAADVLFDDAGNGNVASNVLTFLWDVTKPIPTIASTTPQTTNEYPFPLNITFDSLVAGFIVNDVVITGSGGGGIQVNTSTHVACCSHSIIKLVNTPGRMPLYPLTLISSLTYPLTLSLS